MDEHSKGSISDAICIFTFIILSLMAIQSHLNEAGGYNTSTGIVTSIICLMPLFFRRGKIMKLPLLLVVLIELAIFLHGYGVMYSHYDSVEWYDSMTHTTSSAVVGLCVFYALMTVNRRDDKISFGKNGIALFIVMVSMTFGIYWEVSELIVDVVAGTNMQYSPFDTMRDMLSNFAGGLIVAVYVRWFLGRHSDYDVAEEFDLHPKLIGLAAHSNNVQ